MLKCSVFKEKHESGESQYHFPILAEEPLGWGALAREVRKLFIYAGFSDEHTYYWTGFVYGCVPDASPGGKTAEDLDPDPWLSNGGTTLDAIQATSAACGPRPCHFRA